ncbi:hypothetical protein L6452_01761 [Arctium lappa]|uniref:Uncharacterized protein n=1 Tax=Arctium lappa TaxID=4217 RepID=A0ACB9FIU6_ARCLA|nr:hypothetical protein L6452_01761 [Arctium lappa]
MDALSKDVKEMQPTLSSVETEITSLASKAEVVYLSFQTIEAQPPQSSKAQLEEEDDYSDDPEDLRRSLLDSLSNTPLVLSTVGLNMDALSKDVKEMQPTLSSVETKITSLASKAEVILIPSTSKSVTTTEPSVIVGDEESDDDDKEGDEESDDKDKEDDEENDSEYGS